jgi:hypothetical protein
MVSWQAEPGQAHRSARGTRLEIYQDSSGGENWQSRNHVNREGRVCCSFRGYRLSAEGRQDFGLRASPVVALGSTNATLSAAVPEFWQQFPRALTVDDRTLRVEVFPSQFADLFELQGGEQKTHAFWLDFTKTSQLDGLGLGWVHGPARVLTTPAWYSATETVPFLGTGQHSSPLPIETFIAEARETLLARREVIDEYGWRNFGEVYADHESAHYEGPAPVVSHYNNQYDVIYGALLQFLRTGEPAWADLFIPLARHVIDIDIYHTSRDRAAYNGGLFWHTDHYLDAATCTHRTYSRANQPSGRPYGGGPCNEHNYTTGLLHYYYLTGDPGAHEAVSSLANWVKQVDDGKRTLFGLLDDGPTGRASSTAEPHYHGPGRGCGNSINALIDGWLLAGDRGYLDKAEELIRRCIHPSDDIAGRNLLDVEMRWSYTVFLSVLARYLQVKAEAGEVDIMYAYARASLLHYASWMLHHEVPYFDHPEKLEFPTETWAAQDFRKANVLRLASSHVDEPVRAHLLQRGDELAQRAWQDLMRFDHPATTRAVALLLVEGMRDIYFAKRGEVSAPRPEARYEFGAPERFTPQRQRVLAEMKNLRGLLQASLRLLDFRRWWRLLWNREEE